MEDLTFPDIEAPRNWPPAHLGLTRHKVDLGDYRLSYVTGGQGDPVLLLHGVGACSYAWRWALSSLTANYTVYALDLLGCGESDKPAIDYTLDVMADCVERFMNALHIQRAHFIGHSFGGGITMQLYQRMPERFDRIVFVASGGMGRDMHWLLRMSTLPGASQVLGALSDPRLHMPQASRAMERRRLRRLRVHDPYIAPTVLDRLRDLQSRAAFLSMLREVGGMQGQRISALDHLQHLDVPVLIIWGVRDNTLPVEHGYAAVQILPRAYLEVLPDCFHRPQIESPVRFNALVLDFLQAAQWPPAKAVPINPKLMRNLARERFLRIAPAAMLVGVPAGVSILLRSRTRRRQRLAL